MLNIHAWGRAVLVLAIVLVAGSSPATSSDHLATWLYETAKKMPHSSAPGETPEDYQARLKGMARALANSTEPYADAQGWTRTELSLAELELWNAETLFDQRVHAGLEHPKWTQDNGKAHCFGQIHISQLVPQEEWEKTVGTSDGATQACANATARIWVAQARQCGVWSGQRADRNKVAKVFAAYATGGNCTPQERDWARADKWIAAIALRPDHEKKTLPGYRRVGAREVPEDVRMSADGIVDTLSNVWPKENRAHLGDTFTPENPKFANYKLLVEKHADGKIGVSVFLKE
jgi:hypothetical protein